MLTDILFYIRTLSKSRPISLSHLFIVHYLVYLKSIINLIYYYHRIQTFQINHFKYL